MKKILFLSLFVTSCTLIKPRTIMVKFSDDIILTKDAILVCPYIAKLNAMQCMSMEEFIMRSEPKDP